MCRNANSVFAIVFRRLREYLCLRHCFPPFDRISVLCHSHNRESSHVAIQDCLTPGPREAPPWTTGGPPLDHGRPPPGPREAPPGPREAPPGPREAPPGPREAPPPWTTGGPPPWTTGGPPPWTTGGPPPGPREAPPPGPREAPPPGPREAPPLDHGRPPPLDHGRPPPLDHGRPPLDRPSSSTVSTNQAQWEEIREKLIKNTEIHELPPSEAQKTIREITRLKRRNPDTEELEDSFTIRVHANETTTAASLYQGLRVRYPEEQGPPRDTKNHARDRRNVILDRVCELLDRGVER